MADFLNFAEISSKIPFKDVLDWLNIPYSIQPNGEIRGEGFIINPAKNLYLNPNGDDKGSIINFLASRNSTDLRTAAKELKDQFLITAAEPKRELPNLELQYCSFLKDKNISEELAKELEIGLVKQHSIISGRIAFKTYDENGNHSGYVAYHPTKNEWFFPKNFRRTLYNPKGFTEGFLTVDLFTCVDLISKGFPAFALIGKSMTDAQEAQLALFSHITIIHPEPSNIALRLAKHTFVKISPD